MKVRLALLTLLFAALSATGQEEAPAPQPMTAERLGALIEEFGSNVQRGQGGWVFEFFGRPVSCLVAPQFDRMRFVAPIVPLDKITEQHKDEMLAANIHTALDVRYGTNKGIVYAAFIHPLSPLTDEQVVSAMQQVSRAALTFGKSYSSTDLTFDPEPPKPGEKSEEEEEIGT